ncbi:hypothetical protein HYV88_05215 [Candidatus Woesearchaeota archaeon]|nr:hypothetical protein [Candidatus Woesearchaeota archaeon]
MKKPTFLDIVLLIVVILLIILFIWRIFGTSPTLEQIGLVLTIFFGLLSLESRSTDNKTTREYTKYFIRN